MLNTRATESDRKRDRVRTKQDSLDKFIYHVAFLLSLLHKILLKLIDINYIK